MDAMIENMRSTFGSGVRKMFSNNNQNGKNNTVATSDAQPLTMSLTEICAIEGSTVPFIVRDICKFILKQSLQVEGIFRVNASARLLTELRVLYESNTNYDDDLLLNRDEVTDIVGHAAAGLLKKFMRQLSEPLIHEDVLRIYLDSKTLSDQVFCEKIKLCINEWPPAHRDTLLHLLTFLHTVAQESKNRMSVNSLAVVFGPNVFKLPEGPEAIRTQTIANQAFERLLSCSYLLSDRAMTPKKTVPTPAARPSPPARRALPSRPQEQITPTVTLSPIQKDPTPTNSLSKPVPAVRKSKFTKAKTEPIYDVIADGIQSPNGFGDTVNSDLLDTTSSPFTSPAVTFELDLKSLNQDELSPRSKSWKSDSSEIPELIFEEDGSVEDSLNGSGNNTGELKFADDNSAILEDSIRAIVRTRLFNSTESSSVSDDAERSSGLLLSTAANRDRGPKNRRKPTRCNRLLNNVQFDDSDGDDTIATPTNSDITTARSAAMDSVVTVLTPKAMDFNDDPPSNNISRSNTSLTPPPVPMTSSVTTVTTPDSGCVVDEFSAIKTELSTNNVNRSPVVVPKLNLRSSLDEDDFLRENETATPLNGESVPQLDLSSVTESVDREIVKPQKRTSHAVATSPKIAKPVAKKKKKKVGQVAKKQMKASSESNLQSDDIFEEGLEDVKERIAQALRDNRRIAGRPFDITKMALEELKEEKLSMQRELLKYEARYGRPSTKEEKQIMREIYDRYRAVKRLLVANEKEFDENDNTLKPELHESFLLTKPLGSDFASCDESDVTQDGALNTPTTDLLSQLREMHGRRKRLRRILRDFESRRVEENLERRIMRSEYDEYRVVKLKIRDLESTLTKKGVEIF